MSRVSSVENDRKFFFWDSTTDQVISQSVADYCSLCCMPTRPRLQGTYRPIFYGPLRTGSMVYHGIFPESTDFINNGNSQFISNPESWNRVQYWGVCMQQVRPFHFGNYFDPFRQRVNELKFTRERDCLARRAGSVVPEIVDLFFLS